MAVYVVRLSAAQRERIMKPVVGEGHGERVMRALQRAFRPGGELVLSESLARRVLKFPGEVESDRRLRARLTGLVAELRREMGAPERALGGLFMGVTGEEEG